MWFSRYGAVLTGSVGVVGLFIYQRQKQFHLQANSLDENLTEKRKWDYNWDRMAPPPAKEGEEEVKSKASRTLILIRHGQYVWDPNDPDKRILTPLGRKQAAVTGQRLQELGHSYLTLHYSTMLRATETAQIILQTLTNVPTRTCDLMREGSPIRPEPKSRTWRPEEVVICNELGVVHC